MIKNVFSNAMIYIELQWGVKEQTLPTIEQCNRWVGASLIGKQKVIETELTIRIVNELEIQALNRDYRGINKPTNVLSFEFDNLPGLVNLKGFLPYLGDLAICDTVIKREAAEQNKTEEAHWAHMIIHGSLHLQGYDHIKEIEAKEMEALEIKILQSLGYKNPYL